MIPEETPKYYTFADYKRDHPEEMEAVEVLRNTPVYIKYKMGKRWFRDSCGLISYKDSWLEVSRLWAISSISRVYVYSEDGEPQEFWCKAELRREDKETDRICRVIFRKEV